MSTPSQTQTPSIESSSPTAAPSGDATATATVDIGTYTAATIPFTVDTSGIYTLVLPNVEETATLATVSLFGATFTSPLVYTPAPTASPFASTYTIPVGSDKYILLLPTGPSDPLQLVFPANKSTSTFLPSAFPTLVPKQTGSTNVAPLAALGAVSGVATLAAIALAWVLVKRRKHDRTTSNRIDNRFMAEVPYDAAAITSDKLLDPSPELRLKVATLERENARLASAVPSSLNDLSSFLGQLNNLNAAVEQVFGHYGAAAGKALTMALVQTIFSNFCYGIDDTASFSAVYRTISDQAAAHTWRAQTIRALQKLREREISGAARQLILSATQDVRASARNGRNIDNGQEKYIRRAVESAMRLSATIGQEQEQYEVLYARAGETYQESKMEGMTIAAAVGGTRTFGLAKSGTVVAKIGVCV